MQLVFAIRAGVLTVGVEHVRDSSRHMPVIAFSPRTRWDEGNPWSALRAQGAEVVRLAKNCLYLK